MPKRLKDGFVVIAVCLLLIIAALPINAYAVSSYGGSLMTNPAPTNKASATAAPVLMSAATSPSARLRAAIDNLTTPFTLEVNDPNFDLDKFIEAFDFSGVRELAYSGSKLGNVTTVTWEFAFTDNHAVLTALEKPMLSAQLTDRQLALKEKCSAVFDKIIKPEMTDFEKELAIHDYLLANCKYDYKTSETRSTKDETPFTAYGALVKGLAVCQGITEAANILLTMAGIENYVLESDTHTWNLVKLNDGYYHLDITWDINMTDQLGTPQYLYFNLTDTQILRYSEHQWLKRASYPKAEATTYHYFAYNNLMARNYEDIKEIISKAASEGKKEVTLWVDNHRTYAYNWDRDLAFIFNLKSNGKSIQAYSYIPPNDGIETLTVTFE